MGTFHCVHSLPQRPGYFSSAPRIVTSIWEGPFSSPEPPFLVVTWSAKRVALGTRMGKVQFSEHAQRSGTNNNNKNNHPTLFKHRFRVARESYYLRVNERLWERGRMGRSRLFQMVAPRALVFPFRCTGVTKALGTRLIVLVISLCLLGSLLVLMKLEDFVLPFACHSCHVSFVGLLQTPSCTLGISIWMETGRSWKYFKSEFNSAASLLHTLCLRWLTTVFLATQPARRQ